MDGFQGVYLNRSHTVGQLEASLTRVSLLDRDARKIQPLDLLPRQDYVIHLDVWRNLTSQLLQLPASELGLPGHRDGHSLPRRVEIGDVENPPWLCQTLPDA